MLRSLVGSEMCIRDSFYCVCCNTLHFLEPKLRALPTEAQCPLVSIVEVTARYCEQHGVASAAVLGSALITNVEQKEGGSPYARMSCELDRLSEEQKDELQQGLQDIKQWGPTDVRVEDRFKKLAAGLTSSALVLACTELPLLDWERLYGDKPKPELIDPTVCLAEELVARYHRDAPSPAKRAKVVVPISSP
eukprot:TRINITY_DN31789_c0_g1_i2.p1 TRINITY_DN31789_c0_g1~~TRINITY_DN31789_c0_g1_i2.p1  ORF type:complete len:192 (-),score=58.70 TRINITY_DN31789_c0_g1_i2:59-634(-)